MKIVVDANVLFAALIRDLHTRHYLTISDHEFFIPEFALEEISKHKETIAEKTGLSFEEINILLDSIMSISRIKIIPFRYFEGYMEVAKEMCPDPFDAHYFAIALHLDCPIWSNDRRLKKQEKVKVYSSEEMMKIKQ